LSFDESIKILQRHERGRQGRLRALFMEQINLSEKRRIENAKKGPPKHSREEAAVIIQSTVRGFLQRKRTSKMRHEEHLFIGMSKSLRKKMKCFDDANAAVEKRRQRLVIKSF